jgi:CheY-like chemotaxis protein
MAKYFDLRLPQYRCTLAEYPSIHPNFIGREMPEAVGLCEYTEGTTPGAVEAIYVDTAAFKYLALRGSARSILSVYADGVLLAPADYTVGYADGGRTYITFDADRGEAKITFDCEGYSYVDWDWGGSAGGYVRNPAYVILFVLAFFLEIPEADIDVDSFDDLAARYTALGEDDAGYLVVQDEKEASQVLQELLFTYGAKMWVAADGRITVGRKDETDLTATAYLFQQIDAIEEAQKPSGFSEACNYAPVRWRHYPTANLFVGSKVAERASSIAAFEAEIMPSQAFDFPWTDSEALADLRAEEELLKLGFGDQRLQLKVSIEHIDELEILSTIRFQDPWGISLTGAGDVGRYFYIEKLTYDLMGNTIDIEAIDLEWLLREYVLFGDEDEIASNWSSASESDRMWGYMCDEITWEFADGEPGKIMMDENA